MIFEYCKYTDTIRLQPQNYVVATWHQRNWIVHCDMAVPTTLAVAAFTLVHENHSLRYGDPDVLVNALNELSLGSC